MKKSFREKAAGVCRGMWSGHGPSRELPPPPASAHFPRLPFAELAQLTSCVRTRALKGAAALGSAAVFPRGSLREGPREGRLPHPRGEMGPCFLTGRGAGRPALAWVGPWGCVGVAWLRFLTHTHRHAPERAVCALTRTMPPRTAAEADAGAGAGEGGAATGSGDDGAGPGLVPAAAAARAGAPASPEPEQGQRCE